MVPVKALLLNFQLRIGFGTPVAEQENEVSSCSMTITSLGFEVNSGTTKAKEYLLLSILGCVTLPKFSLLRDTSESICDL